jgi:signal peptidase I
MQPALQPGDRVLVWRHYLPQWLKKGQIVLAWPRKPLPPGSVMLHKGPEPNLLTVIPYIKRVVGLPGDKIITYVNELPESERVQQVRSCNKAGERVWNIPPRHFFVRGDSTGRDSLIWGPVPYDGLWGLVIMKLSPTKARQNVP